ncbi:MAG: HD domain-containing protein [Anaerolineae bacterium]|nr:HD domain-containing protein [Anaerolineae bacterium]
MNREQALALLDKYSSADASWRAHCLQVGAASRRLAELVSERGHPIDVEKAEILGLLHDLGRSQEHSLRHGIEGYLLARSQGHTDEGRICLLHVLKGRSLVEAVQLGLLTEEESSELAAEDWDSQPPSQEEKLAMLADALMSDTGLASIEEKYRNARRRYGAQPHHYEDEAWIKGVAAEIEQVLGISPHNALQGQSDDPLR